ncbi:MAG: hypothetical protein ACTSQ7_07390 [Alphaproteobacteria bacterium]
MSRLIETIGTSANGRAVRARFKAYLSCSAGPLRRAVPATINHDLL